VSLNLSTYYKVSSVAFILCCRFSWCDGHYNSHYYNRRQKRQCSFTNWIWLDSYYMWGSKSTNPSKHQHFRSLRRRFEAFHPVYFHQIGPRRLEFLWFWNRWVCFYYSV